MQNKIIRSRVDIRKEHIKLFYTGDIIKKLIALIAPSDNKNEIILEMNNEPITSYERSAEKEINYFLIELEREDPWEYAKYHCNTASNRYSDIQWQFYNKKV